MPTHTRIDDAELLSQFSHTLLEIYRLAREEPLERFLQTMLECIQSLIPFQSAWWGRGTPSSDEPELLQSFFLLGLPPDYFEDWKSIRKQDDTVERVFKEPGKPVVLTMDQPDISEGLKWLAHKYAFSELMCTISRDDITGFINHLSLYRGSDDPAFSAMELTLMQSLMPHLLSAASINQIRNVHAVMESNTENPMSLAVSDANGVLQSSEPGLVDLLLTEWPDWRGPQLPFTPTLDGYHGQALAIDCQARGQNFLLIARPLYPIEQLSAREQDVAVRFGQGRTYKEIAREIGISPNTVRYYLRSIYMKLGINSKADISRLLHDLPNSKPI